MQPDLILIDGSSYLYRAFHAAPPLTNSQGQPTGAVHLILNMLRKLLDDYQPKYVGVIFDAPGKTFRDDLYPDYKANRPPMPDELREQIAPIHEIIKAQGLPLLMVPDVEADDVIGTLAAQASQAGLKTLISTGDKDMAQLVNDHVCLINTMNKPPTLMDDDGVMEKFNVRPDQIIDYLTLVGDTVDNVPGVPKCGPKTAAKWLAAHNTLEALLEGADTIKGKIGENLRATIPALPLSRELVTIKLDVALKHAPEALAPTEPETDKLRQLYTDLELNSMLARLNEGDSTNDKQSAANHNKTAPPAPPKQEREYETIFEWADFERWLAQLTAAEQFAFDTETTSLRTQEAEIVGVSFAIEPFKAAYVPVAHRYPGSPEQLDRNRVLAALKPLLEQTPPKAIGQNLKYDAQVLLNYDIILAGPAADTMLESYVLDAVAGRHDMDSLANRHLGEETIHFEEIAGKGAKQLTFDQIPIEQAGPYAAEDADITLRLHQCLSQQLQPSLQQVYQTLELPLVQVLTRIERNGVLVDAGMLQKQSQELAKTMLAIEQEAYEAAGQPFNLGSPKQLQEILFEKLQIPVVRKTPKGAPSTAEDVLQELAEEHRLPALILQYRSLSKLRSTYTDKLPKQISPKTGRIHTSYHQAVAATGRLSSADPNLQNIPVRTAEGRRIRQAFIAKPDHVLISADYSQIELRIMAHLSKDPGLLAAFKAGADIHSATAAEVFATQEVTTEQRRAAKAINFGLIYGMSAFGLAKQLQIGREEAQQYIDLYFSRYPGVKTFMDQTRLDAGENGYVETVFGRRLYLPEIKARNPQRRQYAERTAINAPMQGTAADIIKQAMIAVDQWLQTESVQAKIIMQVHDELVLEVAAEQAEMVKTKLCELMSGAAELDVPLLVEAAIGNNWDEAH